VSDLDTIKKGLPEEFNSTKVKYIVDNSKYYQIGDGDHGSISPSDYLEEGIPYIRVQNLSFSGKFKKNGLVFISEQTHKKNLKSRIIPNDILIAKTGATVGKLCLIDDNYLECNTTSSVGKITVDQSRYLPKYIFYYLQSQYIQDLIKQISYQKSAQPGFNIDDLVDFPVFSPNLKDQNMISVYLDKKIEKIDLLLERVEKKMELLKEQRTSLINQYVSKGIKPNVEMKDSAVEWIGEIPKHWNIEVLKHISSVELSSVDRHEYEDEKRVNICHYPDVYKNEYINSKSALPTGTCSDNEFEKFSLRRGDILITKDSESPDDIGIPTFVIENLDNTVCGYHLAIIRMKSADFHSEFIYRYIESKNVKNYFYVSSSGITRFGLGKGSIENLKVVVPPKDEQKQIAHRISTVSRTTKQLSERLLARIALLKEYRQSLISSVVTGKVRVTEEMI
jgi:type I restriction enzyme S subunit